MVSDHCGDLICQLWRSKHSVDGSLRCGVMDEDDDDDCVTGSVLSAERHHGIRRKCPAAGREARRDITWCLAAAGMHLQDVGGASCRHCGEGSKVSGDVTMETAGGSVHTLTLYRFHPSDVSCSSLNSPTSGTS